MAERSTADMVDPVVAEVAGYMEGAARTIRDTEAAGALADEWVVTRLERWARALRESGGSGEVPAPWFYCETEGARTDVRCTDDCGCRVAGEVPGYERCTCDRDTLAENMATPGCPVHAPESGEVPAQTVETVERLICQMLSADWGSDGIANALARAGLLSGEVPALSGVTSERIERGANAIWDADLESAKGPWESRPLVVKEHYRSLARAALASGGSGEVPVKNMNNPDVSLLNNKQHCEGEVPAGLGEENDRLREALQGIADWSEAWGVSGSVLSDRARAALRSQEEQG